MAFNNNNFVRPNSLDLPTWMFDSSLTPPPPQQHQLQYNEGFLTQQQQQVARLRHLQHDQQQQNLEVFLRMPQPGGRQWSQPGGIPQPNQQQRNTLMHNIAPNPGGIYKPQPVNLQTPRDPAKMAALARAEAAEAAERIRLRQEERQERERRSKRRIELKKDPSTNYRYYKEYLEYYPLERGDCPNDYLLGLLANQSMPAEPTSDTGLAVQYAKKHWEDSWETKDLEYVVVMAKGEIEEKK